MYYQMYSWHVSRMYFQQTIKLRLRFQIIFEKIHKVRGFHFRLMPKWKAWTSFRGFFIPLFSAFFRLLLQKAMGTRLGTREHVGMQPKWKGRAKKMQLKIRKKIEETYNQMYNCHVQKTSRMYLHELLYEVKIEISDHFWKHPRSTRFSLSR